jgi:hypothetical protein
MRFRSLSDLQRLTDSGERDDDETTGGYSTRMKKFVINVGRGQAAKFSRSGKLEAGQLDDFLAWREQFARENQSVPRVSYLIHCWAAAQLDEEAKRLQFDTERSYSECHAEAVRRNPTLISLCMCDVVHDDDRADVVLTEIGK